MTEFETDLDRVRGRLVVRGGFDVDRARVWQLLTSAEDLPHWLGRPEGLPSRMGARFRIRHDEQTVSTHRVTRWRPYRLLGWSWELPDEDDSSVTFTITPVAAGSVLTVQHLGLADLPDCAAGWWLHLDRLGAHVRGEPRADTCWSEHAVLADRFRRETR